MPPLMKLTTQLAAKCLTGIVAEADRQRREHDSKLPESIGRPNMNGAPHLRARARVREGYIHLTIFLLQECLVRTGHSTTARVARALEGGKIAIPMRILSKGCVGT